MPDDPDIVRAKSAARAAEDLAAPAVIDPTARARALAPDAHYIAGDLVVDLVTGQTGKVLRAESRAIRRPAAPPAKG